MTDDAQSALLPSSDCSCCNHPDAPAIDAALLGGTPVRAVAETFGLSRSAVGRHRLNHLSAEAIEKTAGGERERRPLHLVDVHGELSALADRLQQVVELAARGRKATAATTAMRELRQTLEAIARLQADPAFERAANVAELEQNIRDNTLAFVLECAWRVLAAAGCVDPGSVDDNGQDLWRRLFWACVDAGMEGDGSFSRGSLLSVDDAEARAWRERRALDAAERVEAEVRRRVEVEVERRVEAEVQARLAELRGLPSSRQVLAIEAGSS